MVLNYWMNDCEYEHEGVKVWEILGFRTESNLWYKV